MYREVVYFSLFAKCLFLLGLCLTPKPEKGSLTKAQKDENKKILALAENIRVKRLLEIQNNHYAFRDNEKLGGSFTEYFEGLCEKKLASLGNYGNWKATLIHIQTYCPKDVTFERLNKDWVQGFKDYLDTEAKTKTGDGISLNTKYSYFNKLPQQEKTMPFKGSNKQTFFAALLQKFKREEVITIAQKYSIKPRTADNLLKKMVEQGFLTQPDYGIYMKSS